MSYNLENIPEGTTHVWMYALDNPGGLGYERLAFYKKVGEHWDAYSRLTGWRSSQNTPEWFVKEVKEGFFVPLPKKVLDKQL